MDIKLVRAGRVHSEQLKYLGLKLLEEMFEWGGEIKPTEENATIWFEQLVKPALESGRRQPVLLAFDDTKLVGGVVWLISETPFDTKWKMANGYGTYVEPEHRQKGIATMLRKRAEFEMREMGVQKLVGAVVAGNHPSESACLRLGFVPHQIMWAKDLENPIWDPTSQRLSSGT